MREIDIVKILKLYLNDIINVVEIMKNEGLKRSQSESWQQVLYKTGEIEEENLEYNFHGVGLWIKWHNKIIDFDFRGNEDKKIWGIDSWFAAYYLQSLQIKGFENLNDCQDKIFKTLEILEKKGDLTKHDRVYFFKEDYTNL